MKQATWNDFTESEDQEQEPLEKIDVSGKESCPWCYAPPELYHETELGPACSVCNSVIPTDAEWYKNGVKLVDPADVPEHRLEKIRNWLNASARDW